ncbi:hypothetical protein [Streptomyces sp. CC224B]|uniref:hypothetical protein n=1 Tax=Streptomyces sp. CC224B TaxID=3044571 RepID=UPI0024A8B673|nr:hypothetical protein [Streptomyces sp. CC224B]
MTMLDLRMPVGRFLSTHRSDPCGNVNDPVRSAKWLHSTEQQLCVRTEHGIEYHRLGCVPVSPPQSGTTQNILEGCRDVCGATAIYMDGSMAAVEIICGDINCNDAAILIAGN